MNNFIKLFLIGLLAITMPTLSFGQTAALLPNAKQTFVDQNGRPLTSGTVTFYVPSTTTLKNTWQDADQGVLNANPVVLDAAGRAIIYGDGEYRQVVKDRNGNTIWDQVTASTGTGGSAANVGDGNLVGTILPWANLVAPPNYVFTYGQELDRTDYPEYLAAVTLLQTVFCTSGNATLTGIADTTQIPTGAALEASCLPAGSTVLSKTSSTVVTSNLALATSNVTATFFPYGNGNGTTTFNVIDLRGRAGVGRDNMGGTASSRLTTTYYGANPAATGAAGGSQSQTLTQAQLSVALGTATSVVTDPGHAHVIGNLSYPTAGSFAGSGARTAQSPEGGAGVSASANTTGITVATTITNASGGNPHTIVQPSITLNYIVKVTPDTSGSVATGVASLGGMTGVIACGVGLVCTANTIEALAGSGTVNAGTSGQMAYYAASTNAVSGNANANISSGALTLGTATSVLGSVILSGSTSGTTRINPNVAASGTLTLPAATDTLVGKATSDVFTNKTYDTAGSGNSFSINSVAVTANTGTGAVARASSPTFVTPTLGAALATSINGVTISSTTGTLTVASGKTLTVSNSLTLAGTDSTTMTFPSTNGTVAALNIASQTVTGGAIVTALSIVTGSYAVNCGNRQLQYITNGGAFTITAPSNDSSCYLMVTNNGSAGAITFSGFSVGSSVGDALTTTNGNIFTISIWRINSISGYRVAAMQ